MFNMLQHLIGEDIQGYINACSELGSDSTIKIYHPGSLDGLLKS